MPLNLVQVDPKQSVLAAAIYKYGEEQYEFGLWRGMTYSGLTFIFLLGAREYFRAGYANSC